MAQSMLLLSQTTAAFFLALLFVRAALHKLGDRYRFQGILADYELLPEDALPAASVTLPVIELAAAVMLIMPSTRPIGAALAGTLLVGYAIAMAIPNASATAVTRSNVVIAAFTSIAVDTIIAIATKNSIAVAIAITVLARCCSVKLATHRSDCVANATNNGACE